MRKEGPADGKQYLCRSSEEVFFYKHLFSSGMQPDWNEIPFTTKQQLREADPYELLGTSLSNVVTYHETSGTTGKPSSSWFSYSDIEVEAAVLNNSALAFTENDLILNRFPFAVALPAFLVYWATQKSAPALSVQTNGTRLHQSLVC